MNNFFSKEFLEAHIKHTMSFYDPRSVDENGGFYHFYKDNGSVYDSNTRHLVSSTRFVFNNAMAYLRFKNPLYLERAHHGIDFIDMYHRDETKKGYAWLISVEPDGKGNQKVKILDDARHCYGLAFVMLAYACGLKAGIESCRKKLREVYDLMEEKFWLKEFNAYASEADSNWKVTEYRGQNDNMHSCEAMIAAYEASGDKIYLKKAELLAETFTVKLAGKSLNQVWEHFKSNWEPDLEYNKGDKTNIFRPWGFQTGHQTEWAKLLLLLDQYLPKAWHLARAEELFLVAMEGGWDQKNTGLRYGYDLELSSYDDDKYFWVQAESFAAAAMLYNRTRKPVYAQWYNKIWEYSWTFFVDHKFGAWYRILSPDNKKVTDEKTPAGKTDYHTMGACLQVLMELYPE